ncbi:WbqC family protein [Spirosoma sp. BT702]|uniref:WbqC family protein n=1 Tax=Spirosoma profusum TaxID=2771354 RepID=A0A927G9M9_9BACT|nr:WbqC family protein [Spirosoma profusum]MBD2704751.1 WbqC family protein [Spirosoma profusum]
MLLLEKYQLPSQPTNLVIELHYLPCLDYITGLMQFEQVWIEAQEHYQKQSYRNRCYVLTANKVEALAVPVQQGTHHLPVRSLRIDNDQPWQLQHWRCLQAAYGKAPFFDYYAPDLELVYQKRWTFLFDLNYELLTICLKFLRYTPTLNLTNCYEKATSIGFFDARSRLNPRQRVDSYIFHRPAPYQQNFGVEFVPNLSIVDLIFCQGPAALDVLKAGFRE